MIFLHTQSFPLYSLDRIFALGKKAGFDGIEVMVTRHYDTQDGEYIRELEARHGIAVKGFCMQPGKEEDLIEPFEKVLSFFEGTMINLNTQGTLSFQYRKWIKNKVPSLSRQYNLLVNRRNMPNKNIFGLIPERTGNSRYELRETGNVCLDLSAFWASNKQVMGTVGYFGDTLKHLYISNVHNGVFYMPLTKGILPLESYFTKLAQSHYRRDFTLKIASQNLPQGNEEEMVHMLQESKKFFDQYFVASQEKVDKRDKSRVDKALGVETG